MISLGPLSSFGIALATQASEHQNGRLEALAPLLAPVASTCFSVKLMDLNSIKALKFTNCSLVVKVTHWEQQRM